MQGMQQGLSILLQLLYNILVEPHERTTWIWHFSVFDLKIFYIDSSSIYEIFYVTLGIQPFNHLVPLQLISTFFAVERGD